MGLTKEMINEFVRAIKSLDPDSIDEIVEIIDSIHDGYDINLQVDEAIRKLSIIFSCPN